MNDSSVESTLVNLVLPDVSLPLGSSDNFEPIHVVEDSEAGVAWAAKAVVCLCRVMESIAAMEEVLEVLETTSETVWPLPSQETTCVPILLYHWLNYFKKTKDRIVAKTLELPAKAVRYILSFVYLRVPKSSVGDGGSETIFLFDVM